MMQECFMSLSLDALNAKKLIPTIICFSSSNSYNQRKLLENHFVKDETSDII